MIEVIIIKISAGQTLVMCIMCIHVIYSSVGLFYNKYVNKTK